MQDAYVGIDVACAKRKLLPINVSTKSGRCLIPLSLRCFDRLPPRGEGNIATLDGNWLTGFAEQAVVYLRAVEMQFDVRIRRIAIDSPSDPKQNGQCRRKAESALAARNIPYFKTPSEEEFQNIRLRALEHLSRGGRQACLPHANQLWMLVGFALFQRLRKEWECLEIYPHATANILECASVHKSKPEDIRNQLRAVQPLTGWPDPVDSNALTDTGHGKLHDCLDAYVAAWVASLSENERLALGEPPFDSIWVPRTA